MKNNFTLGVCGAVEPNITFLINAGKEVMRIDKNGVTINPEIPLDEAAQHVINALDAHIQHIVREALAQPEQEPVAWKWHKAPVKTSWGHEMFVADLGIDRDHTVSIYCERDQIAKVEAMFTTPPAAQP